MREGEVRRLEEVGGEVELEFYYGEFVVFLEKE